MTDFKTTEQISGTAELGRVGRQRALSEPVSKASFPMGDGLPDATVRQDTGHSAFLVTALPIPGRGTTTAADWSGPGAGRADSIASEADMVTSDSAVSHRWSVDSSATVLSDPESSAAEVNDFRERTAAMPDKARHDAQTPFSRPRWMASLMIGAGVGAVIGSIVGGLIGGGPVGAAIGAGAGLVVGGLVGLAVGYGIHSLGNYLAGRKAARDMETRLDRTAQLFGGAHATLQELPPSVQQRVAALSDMARVDLLGGAGLASMPDGDRKQAFATALLLIAADSDRGAAAAAAFRDKYLPYVAHDLLDPALVLGPLQRLYGSAGNDGAPDSREVAAMQAQLGDTDGRTPVLDLISGKLDAFIEDEGRGRSPEAWRADLDRERDGPPSAAAQDRIERARERLAASGQLMDFA